MMRKSLRYWPYIVLAIIIMGPMWLPGYILTMDMVFTPHPPVPTEIAASYPFYVLLHYASFLVPMDVLQKILLTGILSAAGIGMHRLLNTTLPKDVSGVALYVGGIFYMVNSFICSSSWSGANYGAL